MFPGTESYSQFLRAASYSAIHLSQKYLNSVPLALVRGELHPPSGVLGAGRTIVRVGLSLRFGLHLGIIKQEQYTGDEVADASLVVLAQQVAGLCML